MWVDGKIEGVKFRPLQLHRDDRGWLCELFRNDEIDGSVQPVMGYISMARPGITRGPHEHTHQADQFAFLGPSDFKLYLWDNRRGSKTFRAEEQIVCGDSNPIAVQVPPGVVHAYKNIGRIEGLVYNFPNRLYAGADRTEKPDEIRYEGDSESQFVIEDR